MAGNRFSSCSMPDVRGVELSLSEFGTDEGISFLSSVSLFAFNSCTFSAEISSGSPAAASCSRSEC